MFNEVAVFKVIHKNTIGKILYDSNISGAFSKSRKVAEKSHKNQLKVALVKLGTEGSKPQVQYCLINFSRKEDMEEFEKEF